MSTQESGDTYGRLLGIGLKDRFAQQIIVVVALATAASIAINVLGSGINVIITMALLLSFGVIFVILKSLIRNMNNSFVRTICLGASGVIMLVFLSFAILLVPAATMCW